MTESLPEPLMLNGEPHYTALQIAEMRLPGMPGTERGIQLLAARHGWPRRRRSGRGGGRVYPLEALPDEAQSKIRRPAQPKPTQPAPADSASTQKKTSDKKRLFLALGPDRRAMVEAKAEAVGLWRQYRRNLPREVSIPEARKAFCTLWKAGHAGAEERAHKALPAFAAPLPVQMGQGSGEGRSERTGRPAWSGAGRTRHPRQRYKDARRGSRYAGYLPTCRRDPPRARAGGAFFLLSAPLPVRPHHPALDETMEGEEQGTLRTPKRSGRGERSPRRLRRTGRRRCGFTECALGDRRHQGRCAAVRRAEAHHTRHHRRLEPPRAAACRTHITLECRLHRTAPRDPRVGSAQCRAMRQRKGVHLQPHTNRSQGPRDRAGNRSALPSGVQTLHRACTGHIFPRPA